MKKRWLVLGMCVLAAALCAVRLASGTKMLTAREVQITASDQRDFMQAALTYDAGTRTLRGTQSLRAVNRSDTPLSQAVLRLCMNGQNGGSVAVTNVCAGGERVPFRQDEDDPTLLHIALDWQPGETAELSWSVMITHGKTAGASVITLPSLAMLKEGEWRADSYDPLAGAGLSPAFDYSLSLTVREDVKAAFGGALISCSEETAAGERLYAAQMQGARDVGFALLRGGKIRQKEASGVLLTALSASAVQADSLLSSMEEAIASLEAIGIAYPFSALSAAVSDTVFADGDVFSGLIAVGMGDDKETLLRRITRLTARQTFGVLVGNDPFFSPWLSHSFASASELLAFRHRKGEAAYQTRFFDEIEIAARLTRPYGVTVGAGVESFGSAAEMTQVLRDQGAAMLLGIGQAAGEQVFLGALRQYVQDNAYTVADRSAFERALESSGAGSWTGYLDDELSF